MSKVKNLEKEVASLTSKEYARFRAWFEEYNAKVWDEEFKNDVESGKLDNIAKEAIKDYKKGNFRKL